MVCIYCAHDTCVTNSRHQRRANNIWRRRKCANCSATFTTTEQADLTQALLVRRTISLEPFQRDKLFLSVYDSLRHRHTATQDATALTATIICMLTPHITNAQIDREYIINTAAEVLEHFDNTAATHYRAFHQSRADSRHAHIMQAP